MAQAYSRAQIICISLLVFVAVALAGLGIADAVIYSRRISIPSNLRSNSCQMFAPNQTTYVLEKNVWSQWNWFWHLDGYNDDTGVQMQCPTSTYDSAFMVDGRANVATNGKMWSTESTTDIYDCNGNHIFTINSGNIWQTLVNGNGIYVKYQIIPINYNSSYVGYVAQENWFGSSVTIYDLYQQPITTMTWNALSTTWKWNIQLSNSLHPVANIRLIGLIAGKTAFSSGGGSDLCNQFFWAVAYLWFAVFALIAFVIGMALFIICRRIWLRKKVCGKPEQPAPVLTSIVV